MFIIDLTHKAETVVYYNLEAQLSERIQNKSKYLALSKEMSCCPKENSCIGFIERFFLPAQEGMQVSLHEV